MTPDRAEQAEHVGFSKLSGSQRVDPLVASRDGRVGDGCPRERAAAPPPHPTRASLVQGRGSGRRGPLHRRNAFRATPTDGLNKPATGMPSHRRSLRYRSSSASESLSAQGKSRRASTRRTMQRRRHIDGGPTARVATTAPRETGSIFLPAARPHPDPTRSRHRPVEQFSAVDGARSLRGCDGSKEPQYTHNKAPRSVAPKPSFGHP